MNEEVVQLIIFLSVYFGIQILLLIIGFCLPSENKEQESLCYKDTTIYKEKLDDGTVISVYENELDPDYSVLHELEKLKDHV
jgi:hypothetical protein